jgi:ABC-2 type transport system ATP-binding protein
LNGAGKTTTLRILACDLLPSSGTVRVGGVDVVENPHQVRKKIGYLPDTPPLYDEMTVRQYLAFAAKLRQLDGSQVAAAVERAASSTALNDVLDVGIAALSHGYRQRVGIAQAIVHRPQLVVLDEPSGGLDPIQIKEMRALVRSLGGEHTVLVSSHNLPEISEMCDRLLVIGDGQIVASGSEAELVAQMTAGQQFEALVRLAQDWTFDKVKHALESLPGIARVTETRSREPGERLSALLIETDREARGEISRALVASGCDLLALQRSERELENVFAKLARGRVQEEAA